MKENRQNSCGGSVSFIIGALYASIYLGQGFFYLGLVAILRSHGTLLEQLGWIHLMGIFWVGKFVWAPVIDRYRPFLLPHPLGWILLLQLGMAAALMGMFFCDLTVHFHVILLFFAAHSFLSSTQEICVSSLALKVFAPSERGTGGGLQTAGGFWGTLIGGGGLLVLYPYAGWGGVMLVMIGLTLFPLALLPLGGFWESVSGMVFSGGGTETSFRRIAVFWKERAAPLWSPLLIFYGLGTGLGWGVLVPALTDRGWSLGQTGMVVNCAGALLGMLISLGTGPFLRTISRQSAIMLMAVFSLLTVATLPCLIYAQQDIFVTAATLAFFAGSAFCQAVLVTFMMDYASQSSPATDFSVQFCLFSLMGVLAPALGALLAGRFGYLTVFLLMIFVQATALFLGIFHARWITGQPAAMPSARQYLTDKTDQRDPFYAER